MLPVQLCLLPVVILLFGAMISLAAGSRPALANTIGSAAAVVASAIGLLCSAWWLVTGHTAVWNVLPGQHIPLSTMLFGVDPLSAFFAVPVFAVGGLAAIYGASYLRDRADKDLGAHWFAFDLLLAGLALLLFARDAVVFLSSWEVMSLAAWAALSFEHEKPETRRAGWIYLVATHIGVAALFVLFLELQQISGAGGDFTAIHPASPPSGWLMALALVGFGAKAGLVPAHVWLPEAHAAAPSHVSAVMSGLVVKMGIYGILRMVLVVGAPAWLGPTLLALGLLGGVIGIGMALSQRDLKRMLAYSTIENVGIISVGLGLAFTVPGPIGALGLAGALLHVWNHALMKGLMFLGAGSVLHGAGSKDLESLGGLMKRMPGTGALMTLGAVAIAGLPPLNGFASEWLIYSGLLRGGHELAGAGGVALMLALGFLAFIGALAAATFARLVGVTFLGAARSPAADHAHESAAGMLVPMGLLALGCATVGLFPHFVLVPMAPLVVTLAGAPVDEASASLAALAPWSLLTWTLAGILGVVLSRRVTPAPETGTWDCGYAAPTSRMQYSARASAQLAADVLLPATLRPTVRLDQAPHAPFPAPARLEVAYPDPLLERAYLPGFRRIADWFADLHRAQHGNTHLYVAYIGVFLMVLLAWTTIRGWGSS